MHDRPTPLWKLTLEDHEVACSARLAPHGIEIEIAHDGALVIARVFESDAEALAWADEKRAAREARGWKASVLRHVAGRRGIEM
jgi:hypothetical protein